jgi:hypothetical protein
MAANKHKTSTNLGELLSVRFEKVPEGRVLLLHQAPPQLELAHLVHNGRGRCVGAEGRRVFGAEHFWRAPAEDGALVQAQLPGNGGDLGHPLYALHLAVPLRLGMMSDAAQRI